MSKKRSVLMCLFVCLQWSFGVCLWELMCLFVCLQWSFGVCLWELMTLGQQPYADIDPFEMSTYLQEGYRISQPLNCPDEL